MWSRYDIPEVNENSIAYVNGRAFTYGTATPTTGPWKKGSFVKNLDPSNGIDAWRCISTGTFGTFSQAGTYYNGSAIIDGITTTGLAVNNFVNVDTGWAVLTGMRVMAVTANSITLDTNANGAGGAVTVSITPPVFYPVCIVKGTGGDDIPSANYVTLGAVGDFFRIAGTTTLHGILNSRWSNGNEITLWFDSGITIKNEGTPSSGYGLIYLNGAGDWTTSHESTLKLVFNGTGWLEAGRADLGKRF